MELKEYITIFKRQRTLFWGIVFAVVGVFIVWTFVRPVAYSTVLGVHVARTAPDKEATDAYEYDNFYRLQADEQFADTLVRWLQSPRIVLDIYDAAHIGAQGLTEHDLSGAFSARRLSSQFVEVKYGTADSESAGKVAEAISTVLNKKTEELNAGSRVGNWFTVVVDEPVTEIDAIRWKIALPVAVLVGMFLGFWGVMGRYYLSE